MGLAKILVCLEFGEDRSRGLTIVRKTLDSIKRMAAGLASAEEKGRSYKVADYAVSLFAFQQFFHSSYRARQGNVLESAIRSILTDAGARVYDKKEHESILRTNLNITTKSRHDLDVMSSNGSEYLIVQIRSRDDTGGTTAKGSLVEILRDILREKLLVSFPIRYVIYVWEKLQSEQRQSLIGKIIGELQGEIETKGMKAGLDRGVPVPISGKIKLQLAYGPDEFSEILLEITGNKKLKQVFENTLETIRSWDDLWLSYAIASLELDLIGAGRKSNFETLEQKLRTERISFSSTDLSQYLDASENYANKISPIWTEDSLPVAALADPLIYIRDLILLRMVYHKTKTECASLAKQFLEQDPTSTLPDYNKQPSP